MDIPISAMIRRDVKKDLTNLGTAIDQLLSDNESLHQQLRNYNKDAEIQSKDEELRSVYDHALCIMSDKEVEDRRRSWIVIGSLAIIRATLSMI